MNAELQHQLYGGDISDYFNVKKTPLVFDNGINSDIAADIEKIYNTQIKGKPSIDTVGIYSGNFTPPITRDPHFDEIGRGLTNTLNTIAQQLDLMSEPANRPVNYNATSIRPQTSDDLAAANDNVMQALKELKDLNAI